jgi:hypothetical protein
LKEKLANLIEVRKLIALGTFVLFAVLSFNGVLEAGAVQTLIITVISYYFGKTSNTVK